MRNIFSSTSNNFKNDEQLQCVLSKGVYPYKYMDCIEKFQETQIPPLDKVYSQLS